MSPRATNDLVCVAQIGAAHGVRGEVRLRSFTEHPRDFSKYGPLSSEDGGRVFEIEALRPAQDGFVARLRGVTDRNAAEALRNLRLYVPRASLPALDDADTFYFADLIGLRAVDAGNAEIGTIVAVHNFGAGDVIEIAPAGGGPTLMLPFSAATFPSIDIAGGCASVVLPLETTAEAAEPPDDRA